ncbi:hypothetical protein EK904_008530 [Melospiza melodia maxima]|nr:hypothetical protein EK904_008530 [Melospiza melodia maxima]
MALLKVHGPVRMRSMQTGITKWKEGSFEIVEKDNKVNLVVHYNVGGIPTTFQLSHNIKTVTLRPNGRKLCCLMLTLKDTSFLTIDKVPFKDANEMRMYLDAVHQDRVHTAGKPSQGSGSFAGVLGSRTTQKEANRQFSYMENQTPPKRVTVESKEENTFRKVLGTPARGSVKNSAGAGTPSNRVNIAASPASSVPHRTGLLENREKRKRTQPPGSEMSEDYPKENDSSTNNKALSDPAWKYLNSVLPLQSSSFYGSRSSSKEYSTGSSSLDRSSVSSQTSSAKRSLGFLSQPAPLSVKKMRSNQDYTGWNKPRVPLSTHPQQQLQGFSNLGNTCYMNAILQSLFSIQSFANDLLKQGIPWKKIPLNALIRRFAHLLAKKDVCSPEVKKELLKKVKSAISATAERFSGYMQNDAHEFLSQCLDQLKEDMEKLNKTWKSEPIPNEDNSPGRASDDLSATKVYTCPVISNLEFEVQHSIICKMCGETVTKREQFNDLSIDLPRRKKFLPSRSIQDSLDLFFRAEEIEYSCEKCNGKSAVVTHKFNRLPRVLILHLKRYSFNVALSLNHKVGQQVVIPRYLTLLSHCTESTRLPLTLGWSVHSAISRPLKASQMVNSCTVSTSTPCRKYTFKSKSSAALYVDSDSDDEPLKRSVAHSQRLCNIQSRDQQQLQDEPEKGSKRSKMEGDKPELGNAGFDGMSEDELLAAVLEISKREASLSLSHDEDKPTSSPDTGFGDDEIQELPENLESMEMEKPKTVLDSGPANFTEITKDFDENKENKTPEGSQGEVDWLQQYDMEREREEQELQQALAQSLQEQEAREQKEDDDLKRATELSLQEFNSSLLDSVGSDEDSGNEDVLDMEYSEAEAEELKRNAETGELPHSYRLISIVSHIGSTSSSVSRTLETTVQCDRDRSGYIFFYMHKDIFDELLETEKNAQPLSMEVGRSVRQPL